MCSTWGRCFFWYHWLIPLGPTRELHYELKVGKLPNFLYWSLHLQCNGVCRGKHWKAVGGRLGHEHVSCDETGDLRERKRSLSLSALWGHWPSANQEDSPYQKPHQSGILISDLEPAELAGMHFFCLVCSKDNSDCPLKWVITTIPYSFMKSMLLLFSKSLALKNNYFYRKSQ